MAELQEFTEENIRNGTVLMTGGLQRPTKGTLVKQSGGKFVVTDGPFAETKEVVGGFALLEVPTMDAAVALAGTWPGTGPVEVRPVIGM